MKISPQWLRDFIDLETDERALAHELTLHGIAVEGLSGEGAATVYEVEVTTNRVDAMNHYGVARECSAIYDRDLKPLAPKLPSASPAGKPFPILIEDAEGCARYTARVLRNVRIGPSPQSIVKRLESVEQRSINNVADASNYTLWEMGHPTHAFDLDLLQGGTIIVRRARPGEILRTLDGVERKLSSQDLVIADASRPVALAGVMGGFDTMITQSTRNVLIESAWFDPASIRKSSRRHGLHTDASHRYERGADWGATPLACDRVAELILASAGGELEGGQVDAVARALQRSPIQLRRREVERILGENIAEDEIARILRRLGFRLTPGRTGSVLGPVRIAPAGSGGAHAVVAEEVFDFSVQIPTWRLDVEREIDLIEEIARLHGYDKFANTLPEFSGAVVELPHAAQQERLRQSLLALGYNEALSLTFIPPREARQFSAGLEPVAIANPLSEEAAAMRTSLLPGMLEMLAWNLNRDVNDARLFEIGKVYERLGEQAQEQPRIALGATGLASPANVHEKPRPYGFYDLKGDLETLFAAFEHQTLYFDALAGDCFHPGRSARVALDGVTVARFGQLHPDLAGARKIRQDIFIAELYLGRLYQRRLRQFRYTPIPRYPAVDRDFSFIFDDSVTFERIQSLIQALRIPELRSLQPVEFFRGGAVPAGKHSLLLRAEFQSAERTLLDQEVALWSAQIVKALESLGGTQRA